MAGNRFTIGQRVRVVKVGAWNGTPPHWNVKLCQGWDGEVREANRDTIGVAMIGYWAKMGTLQFLPDELEVLDNTSGDSVE